jgi:hypothetical protein
LTVHNLREGSALIELLRTNDPVLISFVASLLDEARIMHVVFDANMSVIEGSIGILPRRLMVGEDDHGRARLLLADAGLDGHVS